MIAARSTRRVSIMIDFYAADDGTLRASRRQGAEAQGCELGSRVRTGGIELPGRARADHEPGSPNGNPNGILVLLACHRLRVEYSGDSLHAEWPDSWAGLWYDAEWSAAKILDNWAPSAPAMGTAMSTCNS